MRAFVALSPPAAVRAEIASWAARLAGRLPEARWVRAESLHLTLLFLGEIETGAAAQLSAALAAGLSDRRAFTARLGRLGCFPARGPLRVLWLGVEPEPALAGLAESAVAAAEHAGRDFDRRPFHPHLTLARCKSPWPAALRERLAAPPIAPPQLEFEVASIELMASELAPGGSRYSVLASLALGAPA